MFSFFARRPRAAPAPPAAPAWPATGAREERAARWFATEPPETVALAVESLRALARAGPRAAGETRPDPAPPDWLDGALDRLERIPEPLPVPPHLPRLPWRYLVFVRALCDALETAHGELRRRGIAAPCPLTDRPDPFPPPRAPRRAPQPPVGLGALVAGARLPEDGLRLLLAACAAGIPWPDAAAFWGRLAAPGPAPETASPSEPDRARDDPPAGAPPIVRGVEPAPARDGPPAVAPDPVTAPAAARDPLDAAARAALAALVAAPGFNRQAGDAWRHGGALYVAARAFAREVGAHPWVQGRPELGNRKALYRHLLRRGLIVPDGGQRIWPLWVCEDGQPDPRYVSALKMAAGPSAGLDAGPAFPGWLRPATAREIRAWRAR
ncbi:MAG: hypothetical protein IPK64_21760 [bacterium]|nr:hypothetical protein [bacterium]